MPNIIDELVVLLKLDSKQFDKAAKEKVATVQATAKKVNISEEDRQRIADSQAIRTKKREQQQERDRKTNDRERVKSTQEVGDKVKGIALGITGAFLGFETLKGAIGFLSELSSNTAQLGRDSKNLGISAVGLQTWGNAIERAGGKADEAQSDFLALSQQITAFKTQGQVGPLLQLAQNAGVYARDDKGQVKPLETLLPQIIDGLMKRYSRADAFNLASGAGIGDGLFNLLADPNRAKYLADGQARAFATQSAIDSAQRAQALRAGAKQAVKATIGGAIDNATNFLGDSQEHARDFQGGAIGEALSFYRDKIDRAFYPLGVRNNNPGNLMERDGKTIRHFDTMIGGVSALDSDLDYKMRVHKLNTISSILDRYAPEFDANGKKINNTTEYKAFVASKTGFGANQALTDDYQTRDKLIQAMIGFEQGGKGAAAVARAVATPGAVPGASTTSGDVNHNVSINKVEIHTQATDGQQVSVDFMAAMNARSTSQANAGITP